MWKKIFNRKNIYIGLFAALYCITAGISLTHAVAFFGLANNETMSIMLATAFEIGQAAVLFSLLTSKKDRSKFLPWALMFIFTVVQVMGNVFSSYEYLMVNSAEMLKYFKEPIFIWTDIPDAQCNVILAYLLGGLLPICSLALTSMITNFLEDDTEEKINEITENKEVTKEIENNNEEIDLILADKKELKEDVKEEQQIISEQPEPLKLENNDNIIEKIQDDSDESDELTDNIDNTPEEHKEEVNSYVEQIPVSNEAEELLSGNTIVPEVTYPKLKSQFVNV